MVSMKGKKIVVACSANKMSALADGLAEYGSHVVPFPVIEIKGLSDTEALDEALSSLNRYDWIIFTSVHGVIYFFRRFRELLPEKGVPESLKFCVIGPATEKALNENGFKADLLPERYVAEGVVEALALYSEGLDNLAGRHILLPRAKTARDVLPKALAEAGAQVEIIVCYQTVRAEPDQELVRNMTENPPDLFVFTSSSAVKNTLEIFGIAEGKRLLHHSTVASIGPVTSETLESFGKQVEIIPKESTIESLILAIREYYSSR